MFVCVPVSVSLVWSCFCRWLCFALDRPPGIIPNDPPGVSKTTPGDLSKRPPGTIQNAPPECRRPCWEGMPPTL